MTRRRRSTGKETSPTPSSRRRSAKRNVMRMHLRPSSCGSATATPRTPPTGTVSRPASSATAACSPCPPASAGAILPPETATPWPHSTVTIPTTGSRSASKTGTDNRDCTASTTPRPNRRNAASTSRSTCGSNRATSNGSFRYSASPPASPRRSCSASAAKRSAARSAASRVTTPRPPRPCTFTRLPNG